MKNTITIRFGEPKHGWLPVDFNYNDFRLEFYVSDALNDPIEELSLAVNNLNKNGFLRTTWLQEPGAYFFDFEKKDKQFILTISETNDIHKKNSIVTQLIQINGNEKQILEPFRTTLQGFVSRKFKNIHWSYLLEK